MANLFHCSEGEYGQRRCTIIEEVLQKLLGTSHISLLALATSLQETLVRQPPTDQGEKELLQDAQRQVGQLLSEQIKSVAPTVDLRRWRELHDDQALRYLLSLITAYAQRLRAYVLLGANGSLASNPNQAKWHESHHHIIRTHKAGIEFDFRHSGHWFTRRSVVTIAWEDLPSVQNFEFYHPMVLPGFPPEWSTSMENRATFPDAKTMAYFMDEDDIVIQENYDVIEFTVKTWLRQIEYDNSHWIPVRGLETLELKFA
ncbi:hypothetical protein MMC13_005418 [Lambiella insularis]|nr:hypothetical protein [Lambiella insularis]